MGRAQDTQRFDPDDLTRVDTLDEIRALPVQTEGLFVRALNDAKVEALASRCRELRFLISDGNARVTDAGLISISAFNRLECLDLEWSAVTDAGLYHVAALRSLRWVDLEFCMGVTRLGLDELRRLRPDLEIEGPEV